VVKEFDGLLEADGDEQAYADGSDVDEEVSPGVSGFVGSVDVEHGRVLGGVGGDAARRPMSGLKMSVSRRVRG
jgi:hypothetical protein